MSEVIPIFHVAPEWWFDQHPLPDLDLQGYPTVWWRDVEDKIRFWPRPLNGTTGHQRVVTVLYFENGDPAGFIAQ